MNITHRAALMAGPALISVPTIRPRGVFAAPRADASNPTVVLAELQSAVAAFRTEYDAKLQARGSADVVTTEKLARIDASVGELQAAVDAANVKLAAIAAGAGDQPAAGQSAEDRAYASSFRDYFRTGDNDREIRSAQRTGPRAAMSVGSNPDGGYLAPVEWDRTITDRLKIISPLRDLATVQAISTAGFIKIFNDKNIGSGWVGEVAARPQTTNPQLTSLEYKPGEIYAMPAASQQLLDDAQVDIEQWLANEVEAEFARQEGIAFLTGNGVNKPNGLLTYTTAIHPFGAVPEVATAGVGTLTADDFISVAYDLPSEYSQGARFIMNRATFSRVRGFKDSQGQYLWAPSLQLGEPSTILGYGITELGAMPNVAPGAIPVVFGDFKRGYLVIDRLGIRMLRDPFSSKPFILFYCTKRVGGGVLDPTALRYLRVKAA